MIAAKQVFEQGHARLVKAAESASEAGALKTGENQLEMDIQPPAIFYRQIPGTVTPTTPKRGSFRRTIADMKTPIYTAEGVVVKWSNPLDAEFAESWPAAVQHQDAGLLRHAFRNPDEDAIMDVEQITRSRKALEEMRLAEESEIDELDTNLSNAPTEFLQVGKAGEARA